MHSRHQTGGLYNPGLVNNLIRSCEADKYLCGSNAVLKEPVRNLISLLDCEASWAQTALRVKQMKLRTTAALISLRRLLAAPSIDVHTLTLHSNPQVIHEGCFETVQRSPTHSCHSCRRRHCSGAKTSTACVEQISERLSLGFVA